MYIKILYIKKRTGMKTKSTISCTDRIYRWRGREKELKRKKLEMKEIKNGAGFQGREQDKKRELNLEGTIKMCFKKR
jgi:hypothetical protein